MVHNGDDRSADETQGASAPRERFYVEVAPRNESASVKIHVPVYGGAQY